MESRGRGVLDHPHARVMTIKCGAARRSAAGAPGHNGAFLQTTLFGCANLFCPGDVQHVLPFAD
jgi:hypothetical protein